MGLLGCVDDYTVLVTERCGSPRLCELGQYASQIKWQRTLDNVSQATITIAKTGGIYEPCCSCIRDIEPFCHELQIFRNDEFVWGGPIIEVDENVETVTITARDVLAWLDVRFFPNGDSNGNAFDFSAIPVPPITEIARIIIYAATQGKYDPVNFPSITLLDCDPCIFENVIVHPSTIPYGAVIKAFDGSAFSVLQALTKHGLDFTTFGRSIIVENAGEYNASPALVLTPEMIVGDISFKKDGALFGSRFWMRFVNDTSGLVCNAIVPPPLTVPCPAVVDSPNFFCHGLVERQIQDTTGNTDNLAAQAIGEQYIQVAGIRAPRTIDFKSGATLSPDTPLGINEMVPGLLIKTALPNFCIDEGIQEFRLTDVNVSMDANGETVQLSMAPLNLASGSL